MKLIQKLLKKHLRYDRNTGVFVWRISNYGRNAGGISVGDIAGCENVVGYIVIRVFNRLYLAHRLAWLYCHGSFPISNIDHKNQIKSDNRILNLRLASKSQNAMNSKIPANNTSGYRGVSYHKQTEKWRARLTVNGREKIIGYYGSPLKASEEYKKYAQHYYGEFFSEATA